MVKHSTSSHARIEYVNAELDTVDRQLRADCVAASGDCGRVKACLKNVYNGCFCHRRWQYVPLWNSSWKKGLPVLLCVIAVGSAGAGVCTEKNIFRWHSQQTEYDLINGCYAKIIAMIVSYKSGGLALYALDLLDVADLIGVPCRCCIIQLWSNQRDVS